MGGQGSACRKPWHRSPAQYKLGVGAQACNPSTWEMEAEGSEFKVILGYIIWGHRGLHEDLSQK